MSPPRIVLERECRTFTRYLAGREPTPYVVGKYCDAHVASPAFTGDPFGDRLTAVARRHPQAAFLADAFARFFAPRGLFRKKLVLLLAILESSPPFFRDFDRPMPGTPAVQALGMAARLLVFALALLAGILVFLPLRLLTPAGPGETR